VAVAARVGAQASSASGSKPTLTEADYGRFESVGTSVLSPNGKWLAYSVNRGRGGGAAAAAAAGGRGGAGGGAELRLRTLATDAEKTITGASAPTFSSNNRWLLYMLSADAAGGGRGGRGAGGAGAAPARGGGT